MAFGRNYWLSYVFFLVFTLCIALSFSYDVYSEIEELRSIYGDHVLDKPRKYDSESEEQQLKKRFIFGSSKPYCNDKLGCFPQNGDFSERPINFKPNSREIVNTKFTLFTRTNKRNGQKLKADDLNTISSSLYNKNCKTKFIIHGFLESTKASWFQPMTNEFLENGDFNVITVDWGNLGASKTLYTQATANTRVVAREIVYLIKMLQQRKDLKPEDVHLIGHSLGSHIAGYVGKNLSAAIGRISGLDPAEPYFQGYNRGIRLDPSDAKFVDVIHSDGDSVLEIVKGEGGFGSSELSGHADFFPNGGEDQPNCKNGVIKNVKLENDLYEGLKRFFACDHDRAIKYFTESINDCSFTGIICSSYKDYEDGKCSTGCQGTDKCNSMGFSCHKPATSGYHRYYLHTTGRDSNFCADGFRVKVTMDQSSSDLGGTLDITVSGSAGKKHPFQVNRDSGVLKPGRSYTYQVGIDSDIGDPVGLEVVWTRDISWWRIITKTCGFIGFCTNSIKIKEIELIASNGKSYYFCGNDRSYRSGVSSYLFYSKKTCLVDASAVVGK